MDNPHAGPLHGHLAELFTRMSKAEYNKSPGGRSYYPYIKPNKFNSAFRKLRPEFVKGEQHDAQEYLSWLLEKLHQETNVARSRLRPAPRQEVTNAQEALQYQLQYMDESPYSKIYMGQLESTLTCLSCCHQSRSWEGFWQLQLNLPDEAQVQGKAVSLKGCLEIFMAEETLIGDCAPTCDACKKKLGSKKQQVIRHGPVYLILHLKRFTPTGAKIDRPVAIEGRLSLADREYMLSCSCLHRGEGEDAHYLMLYYQDDNLWTLFDDHITCTNISNEEAHKMLTKMGYIVFYRAILNWIS